MLIDLPKDKYVEEVKAAFEHMIAFNESRGNPISRECMIYKKYKENNFERVKDMHALMKSLSSGLVGRKQEVKRQGRTARFNLIKLWQLKAPDY